MKRALLTAILILSSITALSPARAADPTDQADPFAEPQNGSPAEPDEDALLRGSARPAPQPQSPPPPAVVPAPARPPRRQAQATDEVRASTAAPAPPEEETALALELSTNGFASGGLEGGVFVGGRKPGGMILGGFFDYGLRSSTASVGGTNVTTSAQLFRLGAGVRPTFIRSADRRVDLFGAAEASFEYRSGEVPSTGGSSPTTTVSAAGFSLAVGPGLRFWVHEQIAIGYVARLRLTYLSGDAGALASVPSADASSSSTTAIGFDGTFQILGVF
jgi:hypothetical protein